MNSSEANNRTQELLAITFLSAYLNLAIIGLGTIGNLVSFGVFRCHRSFKSKPSMVYLSFVAITDTLALFEWNLDHFYQLIYDTEIFSLNILLCRLLDFIQYTSLQSSGLLLSVMCVDRYVTVMAMPGSFLQRLPFRTLKSAFVWSASIVLFCALLNFHLLFTTGRYEKLTNDSDVLILNPHMFSSGVELSIWDQVNFVFYNLVPFFVMTTFNTLLIVNLSRKMSKNKLANKKKSSPASLTVSLVILSCLFLAMTTPGTVIFAYFYSSLESLHESVVFLIDDISYVNHASLFLISFVSNRRFRKAIMTSVTCCPNKMNNSQQQLQQSSSNNNNSRKNSKNSNKMRLAVGYITNSNSQIKYY